MADKAQIQLSSSEIDAVLSSLGYRNKSGKSSEWRGDAKCHGGDGGHNFSFKYDKGVAKCWTNQCFGKGTDIFGVVEHETGKNFFYAKRQVEEIIGREFGEEIGQEQRSKSYYDNLMSHIQGIADHVDEAPKKTRWLSDSMWKLYAKNEHPYWTSRGFSKDTLEFFGAGYNPENDRITIPLFDCKPDGSAPFVGMKQRIASDDPLLVTDDNPKYLHDSFEVGKFLFNLNNASLALATPSIRSQLEFPGIILVEGNLDVMMGHQLGQPNIICTGCNYLTVDQARLLEHYTDRVLFIPDEDQKANGIWRGGKLLESGKEYLGKTMSLYVSRMGSEKDLAGLSGVHAWSCLVERIRSRQKL